MVIPLLKRSIFLTVICIVQTITAQDFQNICLPGISFYANGAGNLAAFRRDSVAVSTNNDSVFYSYYTIRDTTMWECKDTTNGSVLGFKVIKTPDGWLCFFNRYQKLIRINSQATLNQTWKFCDLGIGTFIQARVRSIFPDSVLGNLDLVKFIELQAKNSANVSIPHSLNGTILKLSKHYGLTQMLDVYYVPNSTSVYTLAGLTSMNLGRTDLSWNEVYDFEPGDIYHHKLHWWASAGGFTLTKQIDRILEKTTIGNNDAVSYKIERCYYKVQSYPYPPSSYFDTITKTYYLHNLEQTEPFRLPNEFVPAWEPFEGPDPPLYYESINTFNGHNWKGIITGWTEYSSFSQCYEPPFESFFTDKRYTSGLGMTLDSYSYWSGGALINYTDELVYYEKGDEVWGTPVSTDCNLLTNMEETIKKKEISFDVFPNPSESRITVRNNETADRGCSVYSLFNSTGIAVREGYFCDPSVIIERNSLPPGLYILKITNSDGYPLCRIKIMFL